MSGTFDKSSTDDIVIAETAEVVESGRSNHEEDDYDGGT